MSTAKQLQKAEFWPAIISNNHPIIVDESHPFPFISNQSLSFAIELRNKKTMRKVLLE